MVSVVLPAYNEEKMIKKAAETIGGILKKEKIEACGLDEPLLIYRVMKSSRSGNKLKAAAMTFRAYRHIGLSVSSAFKNWMHYTLRSFMKYRKIK